MTFFHLYTWYNYICIVIADFHQYISHHNLCGKNDRILLAVSGGIDSVVMLDLFYQAKYKIAIAHCNFQLRANESDEDERFVKKLGEKYDVEVFIKRFETNTYARSNNLSIQIAARNLRYAWFEELRKEISFDFVAVAHNSDDEVETFFINLSRGSGLTGLKGIPLKRESIIRPVLFANREKIVAYAKKNKLFIREDSSNKEDKYLRNKIRLNLIPELEKLSPKFSYSVIDSINHLNEADILLKQLLEEKFKALRKQKDGIISISLPELEKLQPFRIWLYYLLRLYNFNRDTTDNLAESITGKQTGKIFFSATHKALINRKELKIKTIGENKEKVYLINIDKKSITKPINLSIDSFRVTEGFQLKKDIRFAQLDKDKLKFPLKIRNWKKGDKFKPFGMKGSKLLSDYFIDSKIDLFEKEDIWLLLSGEKIVWVIGYRISDDYKLTNKTIHVLSIKLR